MDVPSCAWQRQRRDVFFFSGKRPTSCSCPPRRISLTAELCHCRSGRSDVPIKLIASKHCYSGHTAGRWLLTNPLNPNKVQLSSPHGTLASTDHLQHFVVHQPTLSEVAPSQIRQHLDPQFRRQTAPREWRLQWRTAASRKADAVYVVRKRPERCAIEARRRHQFRSPNEPAAIWPISPVDVPTRIGSVNERSAYRQWRRLAAVVGAAPDQGRH